VTGKVEVARQLMAQVPDDPLALSPKERRLALERALSGVAWPDFEMAMVAPGGWVGTERAGIEGYVAGWDDWLEPFESFRMEFAEILEGEDVVVVFVRQFGTPRGGGPEVESPGAGVLFFRDGRICRMEFHLDRDEALRSAGLPQ
jgi:ketosteroid isomerase-like protein